MHFLVKVMLFSTENTIFLFSPGRHPLFRAKVDGSFRWFPQEHDFKRPQITKVKIMYVISSAHKPQISGRRGSGLTDVRPHEDSEPSEGAEASNFAT